MRILLVNDDGIDSPGLEALARRLAESHEVTVVAPDGQRSAVGHGLTMRGPLLVERRDLGGDFPAYAVSGTPADCTRLGLGNLADGPVDLVISGPNQGLNVGTDVLYSGTVSAALEAAMWGYKAIAVSSRKRADPAAVVEVFLRLLSRLDLERDVRHVLNVNIPALPLDEIKGVEWTPQALRFPWADSYEQGEPDEDGRASYHLRGVENPPRPQRGTDVDAALHGFVALTPLSYRLTDDEAPWGEDFHL